MSILIYSMLMSLDGYIEDSEGKFDWGEPDAEVHQFINDLERAAGVHLYGRRLYETMAVWETEPSFARASPVTQDFAEIWQAAEKIVYSQTLPAVVTTKTRLERAFDPQAIEHLKATGEGEILIGGPTLATHAFRAGLVDECRMFVTPVTLGGGKAALPAGLRVQLDLLEERRFSNGIVYLRYRTRPGST